MLSFRVAGCLMTRRERCHGWQAATGADRLRKRALRGADLIDWSRVLVDTSFVKAPLGGQKPVRTNGSRPLEQQALSADGRRRPLVAQTAPANEHDGQTLLPLIVELPHVAGKRGSK